MFHGDLVNDTGAGVSALTFYHPTLQKSLIEAALRAGVTVLRGDPGEGVGEAGKVS